MKAKSTLDTGKGIEKKAKAAVPKSEVVLAKITTQKRKTATSTPVKSKVASDRNAPVVNLFSGETGSQHVYSLIHTVRQGINFNAFKKLYHEAPFSIAEWSQYLHLSERTMQRYQKEEGTFAPPQSEKILEIILLLKKGKEVFGEAENFHAWLQATNAALGNIKPKELLDSSFGINLLNDELIRIEHGIFA